MSLLWKQGKEDSLVSDDPEERTYTWSKHERQRLVAIRNCLFKDPGGGVFSQRTAGIRFA